MPTPNETLQPETITFSGSHNNRIVGNLFLPQIPVKEKIAILVHGGGQTRHSWGGTAQALCENGWTSIIFDQRGHGDSDWIERGNYEFPVFADDLAAIATQIRDQFGALPVSIGASLGGIASMLAQGENNNSLLSALILVDITPRMKISGVEKIVGFMAQNAETGFTSLEEAADAIAAYLPQRPRPNTMKGLAKNLRQHDDGRYRWHWDPKFISGRKSFTAKDWDRRELRLVSAAKNITTPILLIRGQQSELVEEKEVQEFLNLVPHAKFTDVSDAGHMIAGDKNDIFTAAVLDFLNTL